MNRPPYLFKMLLLGGECLQLTSCATAIRGTTEPFIIKTEPPGAVVTTSKSKFGCKATPCEIEVPRRTAFIAKVEKEGYIPVHITIRSRSMHKHTAVSTATNSTVALSSVGIAASVSGGVLPLTSTVAIFAGSAGLSAIGAPLIAADAVTGAVLDIYPNPVALTLLPKGTLHPETDKALVAIHIDPDGAMAGLTQFQP